jgi:uncharacterized membrane protein
MEMMWGYGLSWFWMLPTMLLFTVGLIALLLWLVSATSSRGTADSAIETLRRRLAAGEISQDEFETTKRILQG